MDAFLRPVVEMVGSHAHEFVPLIGRLYTEPGDFAARIFKQQFEHLRDRFFPVLERALPELSRDELSWRVHFAIGALAHTMAASKMLELMSAGRCDISDVEGTLARLKAFIIAGLTAGLTAPASLEVHHAAY
jgi:Tetracyclin repressor-like, C-terminal domain